LTQVGMTSDNSNLALLIDADNAPPKYIAGLMAEIANYGTASVRRIYGDWTNPILNGWKKVLLNHSITPIQQFAYTTGKNATDGAMIIDAMDLLYTGRFSSFCIVSSDSDFTRLAARIREQGVTVYGFGERAKTVSAFIAACDKFMYFDALNMESEEPLITTQPPKVDVLNKEFKEPLATPQPPRMDAVNKEPEKAPVAPQPHRVNMPLVLGRTQPPKKPFDELAIRGLILAIKNAPSHNEDWVNLADLGSYLSKYSPNLLPRNYGYERLREFVEASGIVDLKWINMGDKPPVVLASLKKFGGAA
jgi:NYN domain/OST-HTH/LOTUS domain